MMIQDKLLLLEEKLDKLLAEYNAVKQERDLLLEKNNSLLIHIGNIETENSLLKQNKEIVRPRCHCEYRGCDCKTHPKIKRHNFPFKSKKAFAPQRRAKADHQFIRKLPDKFSGVSEHSHPGAEFTQCIRGPAHLNRTMRTFRVRHHDGKATVRCRHTGDSVRRAVRVEGIDFSRTT